jgi:peroxiredoxin
LAEKFAGLDTEVFGVSLDTATSQGKFIARDKLQFSLIARKWHGGCHEYVRRVIDGNATGSG